MLNVRNFGYIVKQILYIQNFLHLTFIIIFIVAFLIKLIFLQRFSQVPWIHLHIKNNLFQGFSCFPPQEKIFLHISYFLLALYVDILDSALTPAIVNLKSNHDMLSSKHSFVAVILLDTGTRVLSLEITLIFSHLCLDFFEDYI